MQKSTNVLIAQEKVFERKLHRAELEAEALLTEARKEAEKTALTIKKDVEATLREELTHLTATHEDACRKLEEQTAQEIARIEKKEKKLSLLAQSLAKSFVREVLTK